MFSVYDPLGVKLLTCLRLQFSHLNKHKFRHGFSDRINPMCACGTKIKTTKIKTTKNKTAKHFFLRCHFYSTKDYSFLKALMKTNLNEDQVNTLLYGSQTNDSKCANQEILKFVIACIKATTRFGRSLISNQ